MTTPMSAVQIDVFGITDRGRVRDANEDNFAIVAVNRAVDVRHTSLAAETLNRRLSRGTGYLCAVADGVGGRPAGDVASERAVRALVDYIGSAADCLQGLDETREDALLVKLEETVLEVHRALTEEYGGRTEELPATTLTMVLFVWPRAYLVHVGDSRAYIRQRGRLKRLTRDQTLGEYMIDAGAWTEAQAASSRVARTLSSAVGGTEILPVVGLVDLEPGDMLLLCTDGLTNHVSDEGIAQVLDSGGNAQTICRQLVDDANAGGGSDNITVVALTTT